MTQTFCYIIEAENGMAKIGVSAKPHGRLTTVAGHSPVCVRLVAMWPGSTQDERRLHERFSDYRRFREWFEIAGDLEAFILEQRGVGVDNIPSWTGLRHANGDAWLAARRQQQAMSLKMAWKQGRVQRSRFVLEQSARISSALRTFGRPLRPERFGVLHRRLGLLFDARWFALSTASPLFGEAAE
jgi:hypothetical protein